MRDDDTGVSGTDIAELQTRLQDLGYYTKKVDGVFGKGTDDAVKAFQAQYFGVAEADGKVGPLTWGKLWGTSSAAPPISGGSFSAGLNYLKLTNTGTKDGFGLYKLKLEYYKDGQAKDLIYCCSGQSSRQFFRKGVDSISGSKEPLPEGKWFIHDIEWAGGRDVYDGSVWESGIGPVWIATDYIAPNSTSRGAIGFHIDWNRSVAPGSVGCICPYNIADMKTLVRWLRDTDPRDFYVDWGLGSITLP
jgi:lysozyme